MYNITKIEGGFEYQNQTYEFVEIDGLRYQIISNSQVHVYTDLGVILFDLMCSINDNSFDNIDDFVNNLLW